MVTVSCNLKTVLEADLKAQDVESFSMGLGDPPESLEEYPTIRAEHLDRALVDEGWEVRSTDSAKTLERLTPDMVATLLFIRARTLAVGEDMVRLELPGMVMDAVKLRHALDQVFQLALPDSVGPYR